MSLPHPRAAANVLAQGINSVGTLSQQVLAAMTQMQVNAIRAVAEAAPSFPQFATGQREGTLRVQVPRIDKVFTAVPEALSRSMPTGATKGITKDSRARGRSAMF